MSRKRNLTLTTVFLDGRRVSCGRRANPGRVLSEAGLEEIVRVRLEETLSYFPGRNFRVVRLRNGNVNLIETPIEQADIEQPVNGAAVRKILRAGKIIPIG